MKILAILTTLLMLTACNTVGGFLGLGDIPAPETPRQRYAAAELAFTAVAKQIPIVVEAGLITPGSDFAASVKISLEVTSAAMDAWHDNVDDAALETTAQAGLAGLKAVLNTVLGDSKSVSPKIGMPIPALYNPFDQSPIWSF